MYILTEKDYHHVNAGVFLGTELFQKIAGLLFYRTLTRREKI